MDLKVGEYKSDQATPPIVHTHCIKQCLHMDISRAFINPGLLKQLLLSKQIIHSWHTYKDMRLMLFCIRAAQLIKIVMCPLAVSKSQKMKVSGKGKMCDQFGL